METAAPQMTEPQRPLNDPPPVKRSAVIRFFVAALAVSVVAPSVLGFLGRTGWQMDLLNHFRFQYALVLLFTTVGLALLRSRRVVWVSLTGLVLNLSFVLPLYWPTESVPTGNLELVIMHRNVNTTGGDPAAVAEAIRASGADLIFLQEVNQRWIDELDGKLDDYELIAAEPRSDNFGIAAYVRVGGTMQEKKPPMGIASVRVFDITGGVADVPVIEVRATMDVQSVAILSIHPLPPVSLRYAEARDASLAAAADWSKAQTNAHLIVGDFNATPWSTPFRDLRADTGLLNSQRGFCRAPTWPSGLMTLGMIPIDHLLHSEQLVTTDRIVGDACGSDHLPLTVKLRWAAP